MDAIFDANKPGIIRTYLAFEKQQAALNALSKSRQVDQARLFAAIDAVNQARAALEKANTQMLLQIRAQLTPDQLAKLDNLP
jgi:Spy/CpxP family protein refolding chaperone